MRLQLALSLVVVSLLSALTVLASLPSAAPSRASVELDVGLGRPVLLANQKNRVHLRVALRGRPPAVATQRPPVNVCIAIDKSGSMSADDKMVKAREGAIQALRRLASADAFSVVAYDSTVRVVVPAGSASRRGDGIEGRIAGLLPGGDTALFGGVVKCAEELRKGLDRDRVNRIILLSDGQANVGPSTPGELGALGSDLMAEGISVATVGLGLHYNEDLMAELALRSDGRHTFVERAAELGRFLDDEMGSVTGIVARDVLVKVKVAQGARPLGILGRPADIVGDVVTAAFGKIYAGRQHFFVLEMEVDPATAAAVARKRLPLADVEVSSAT